MLNPSTAGAERNDPTIARCERRSRALGYGAMRAVNLFALRATRPEDMKRAADPVGPEGDAALAAALRWADHAICAWGVHGAHRGRDADVRPRVPAPPSSSASPPAATPATRSTCPTPRPPSRGWTPPRPRPSVPTWPIPSSTVSTTRGSRPGTSP